MNTKKGAKIKAVFFILTGFSFGAKAKDESKEQESTNSNQD